MKHFFLFAIALILCSTVTAQTDSTESEVLADSASVSKEPDFYYYIIGNWRNGPEVLIGPPIEGSEQKTMEQMKNEAMEVLSDFSGVEDVDIVIEPSIKTAEHSRRLLGAKYQSRNLKVKLLDTLK